MNYDKIGVSGCFFRTCNNMSVSEKTISANLQKCNHDYNMDSINYDGRYLVNNNGIFFVKSQNITNNRKIPKNIALSLPSHVRYFPMIKEVIMKKTALQPSTKPIQKTSTPASFASSG